MNIQLTRGQIAIIDDEDWTALCEYTWHANRNGKGGGFYASTNMCIDGHWTTVSMSRLIMHAPSGMQVDHINRNTLDNRRCNLRLCCSRENQGNRIGWGKTSKYKGVSLRGDNKRWQAQIMVNYKTLKLGIFATEEKAAIAYDEAARHYFREFARTNFA